MNRTRVAVAILTLSASGLLALVGSESYTERAIVPTAGDKPTIGFGSTVYESGKPVQMGDRITPVRALVVAAAHIRTDEDRFRASLPGVALTQGEFDLYVDFVYQYGIANWVGSSMRRHLLAGEHRQACDALLLWRRQAGRDCSQPQHWGPTGCKGVWTRQLERHARCIAEQG